MDWPEPDHGVYAISVAAQLCGLHPQTLRVYEREGLVDPDRTAGGTRLYSGQDVQKLREIAALNDIGINVAGIRRVLELQEEVRLLQAQVELLNTRLEINLSPEASAPPRRRR